MAGFSWDDSFFSNYRKLRSFLREDMLTAFGISPLKKDILIYQLYHLPLLSDMDLQPSHVEAFHET
jgi:hypothetical protein